MKIIEKLDKLAGTLKLVEELMSKTQASQSPKLQRIFKGVQSMEKVHSTLKQAQQMQELLQVGKNNSLFENASLDTALPLILLLLNILPPSENAEENTAASL